MSNSTTKLVNPMKVITGKDTRWSYANVWEAKSINGGTPKFSVSLIIPKSDTVTVQEIKAAIQAAYEEGQAKLKGNGRSVPPLTAIKAPLRDGDTERPDDPAYANSYFINANSATAPGIVDADCNPILTRSEVYSGVYGRASINFYAFNSNGNKGIACGLNNLQKIRDGEPLGGDTKPAKPVKPSATIKVGDLVTITGSTYYNGKSIPGWVKKLRWYVVEVSGDRAVIDKDESGRYAIMSPVKIPNK